MDIRILPSNIANLIAAGEVVQRPESVVKELMENALDAGATDVKVVISDAGRTLIQVIDNGCGMTPAQAELCFERHATSKIASAEDLMDISTFGFRGEALASIAAVSRVTLRTRRPEDPVGCQVEMADSRHLSTEETACPAGSNFAVRDLFYNVPARRKFLKSDAVELKHIVEAFTRVALTRPDVGFSLSHNGRDLHVLRPAKSLKFRIQDLLGAAAVDKIIEISAETSVVSIEGFVCRPDMARKTVGGQYFFVNGRFFRSPYLHKAVMRSYEGLVAEGAVPSYFIYLKVDPRTLDVNIHPAKTEVKFEDDSVIFQVLAAAVHEALGRGAFGASIDFERTGAEELPVFSQQFDQYRPAYNPDSAFESDYNPFETDAPQKPAYGPSQAVERQQDYGKLFEEKTLPSTAILVLDGRYVVTRAQSGLLVVHIRRARERILYERFLKAVSAQGHVSQTALFPVQVTVGSQAVLAFEAHRDLLATLGFDISPVSVDTVLVGGVPDGFSCDPAQIESLLGDVLQALEEEHTALPGLMESALAERFARIGAAGGPALTSPVEAQRLVDALFGCANSEFTAKGLRILSLMPLDEIEKKF